MPSAKDRAEWGPLQRHNACESGGKHDPEHYERPEGRGQPRDTDRGGEGRQQDQLQRRDYAS
jgi:hypothetical protein